MVKEKDMSWQEIHRIQIREILKHKWILSEKAGRDLGEEAVEDWVEKYAAAFRDFWEGRCEGVNHKES